MGQGFESLISHSPGAAAYQGPGALSVLVGHQAVAGRSGLSGRDEAAKAPGLPALLMISGGAAVLATGTDQVAPPAGLAFRGAGPAEGTC